MQQKQHRGRIRNLQRRHSGQVSPAVWQSEVQSLGNNSADHGFMQPAATCESEKSKIQIGSASQPSLRFLIGRVEARLAANARVLLV